MTGSLLPVRDRDDIVPGYRDTPIADLLAYHNLASPHRAYDEPELLVGMCMDHRQSLRIPDRFAYVMRVGGARILRLEFQISFAIAIGGVQAIAVVGHDQCGMVNLAARRQAFIRGLITKAGWSRRKAETHFDSLAEQFEIGEEIVSVLREAAQLRQKYPAVTVAPLMYRLSDGLLYQVDETQGEAAPR
jgi:carbonic anhydrase